MGVVKSSGTILGSYVLLLDLWISATLSRLDNCWVMFRVSLLHFEFHDNPVFSQFFGQHN